MTYLFERNFDEEMTLEAKTNVPGNGMLAESHTRAQNDLDLARSEAFEAGHRQGMLDGRAAFEADQQSGQTNALDTIARHCETLCQDAATHRDALETDMVAFALSACEKVFPELILSRSSERAAAEIKRFLTLAMGSPKLRIRMSESTFEEHGSAIEAALSLQSSTTAIEISTDQELADGDARMEWQNGTMEYSFERLCNTVLSALRSVQITDTKHEISGRPADV